MPPAELEQWSWYQAGNVAPLGYVCGFCGHRVGPNVGYYATRKGAPGDVIHLRICSHCTLPTFFGPGSFSQVPGVAPGTPVPNLPDAVAELYEEIRRCMAQSAWTLAVLGCRKILMNVAVTAGVSKQGRSFVEYVGALASKGYVPISGRASVDRIRSAGNEAAHEIRPKTQAEAERTFRFTEGLLRFAYEYAEPPDAEEHVAPS